MTYTPNPIDTSAIEIDAEIAGLLETLARNTHDLWAQGRIADGWKFGPKRDDAAKEHPSLVPYDELPESEKEYDRRTAMGALKTIIALGYRLEKRPR